VSRWFIAKPYSGAARKVGEWFLDAFEQGNPQHQCHSFDTQKYIQFFRQSLKMPTDDMVIDLMNQALLTQCFDFQPEYVFVPALAPVSAFVLAILRKNGIKTIHWFFEDYRRADYWEQVVASYDYFAALQRGPVEKRCHELQVNYSFLLPASNPDIHIQKGIEKDIDMLFVGIPSTYRVHVLEQVASVCPRLLIAGEGWERYSGPLQANIEHTGWVDSLRYSRYLSRAKAGINLSVHDPSEDRENTHVSPRVFDILGAECALITEDVPLAAEVLNGLSYHRFSDTADLLPIVSECAKGHFSESQLAGIKNRDQIRKKHSYTARVNQLLRWVSR